MYDAPGSEGSPPEPAQKLLYHATGKLYRYLAGFAGEDPDEIEQAYRDSFGAITAGADPVLIGDAIGDGIGLGFSLAERRRALRQYHDELVRRRLAPPAYDIERIEDGDGKFAGLRVLVSEPDCRFFTSADDLPKLLIQTSEGGEVEVPLEFDPGPVEPVESGETVSEVIVRPAERSSSEDDVDGALDIEEEPEIWDDTEEEDIDAIQDEYLDVAREVVLDDPGRAMLADAQGGSNTGRLVASLLERKPSIPAEQAPEFIHEAIRSVGLDSLEERYDELLQTIEASEETGNDAEADDEVPPETEGVGADG
jgi:hypothetical protein